MFQSLIFGDIVYLKISHMFLEDIMAAINDVVLEIKHPEKPSRLLALCRLLFMIPIYILLIPHIAILYCLGLVFLITAWIAQVAVLFVGKYPKGLFDFNVGIWRWGERVNAYVIGFTDKYPPFGLN